MGLLRSDDLPPLDKKRMVILLRSAVLASISYLLLFDEPGPSAGTTAYILILLASNGVLIWLPASRFHHRNFSSLLLLGDMGLILFALLTLRRDLGVSQDFLVVYFFTIFLTTVAEGLLHVAIGAALVSVLYGYWLWNLAPAGLQAGAWLRLPFFFIVAVFYAYLTQQVKRERRQRVEAEREAERLRFLLQFGAGPWAQAASAEWSAGLAGVIEAAFPRLSCAVVLNPEHQPASGAVWFPIAVEGSVFGRLEVTARDGGRLSSIEDSYCRVVALTAARALHSAARILAAEESVRASKEQFLGVLSHEFRTPLHAILGYAEMLEDTVQAAGDGFARESLGRLRVNACRLQDLVEELLCYAELQAGKRALEIEDVHLGDLFEQLAPGVTASIAGRPIRFEWDVAADVPVLRTDRRKLRQMLVAILSNAVKFTERGSVRLRARLAESGRVLAAVEDTGIGIDRSTLPKIFAQFSQADSSLTRRYGGVGLGLALARELASALGGTIRAESELGRGTTVEIELPAKCGSPQAEPHVCRTPAPRAASCAA